MLVPRTPLSRTLIGSLHYPGNSLFLHSGREKCVPRGGSALVGGETRGCILESRALVTLGTYPCGAVL